MWYVVSRSQDGRHANALVKLRRIVIDESYDVVAGPVSRLNLSHQRGTGIAGAVD